MVEGVKPAVHRREIDERLERRAGLALRLHRAVELAHAVGPAARHREHAAGLRVHHHHAAVDVGHLAQRVGVGRIGLGVGGVAVPSGPVVGFSTFSTGITSPTFTTCAGRPGEPPTRWSGRVGRAHCISANGIVPSLLVAVGVRQADRDRRARRPW